MRTHHLVVGYAFVCGACMASEATSEVTSDLTTAPIEICFDGIDNNHDGQIDEGCSFDPPAPVTAYTGAWQAKEFLNVGKTVAVDGTGVVHRAWLKMTTQSSVGDGHGMVMYQRSLDNGATWTAEQALTIEHDYTSMPKIAAFGSNVYVTFHANYVGTQRPYLVRSANSGASFFAIQQISSTTAALPTVAAFGPYVHVVWAAGSAATQNYAEIYIATSSDAGITWTAAKQVSSTDAHSSWTPAVAAWGPRVVVAWTDERFNIDAMGNPYDCRGAPPKTDTCREELFASISNDAGAHFGGELRLTNDGATPHSTWAPSVALWNDYIHIAYFDRQDDQYFQVYYLRSSTAGATWDATKRLSPVAAPTDPMQNARPSIAVLDDKIHLSYWQTHNTGKADVVYTGSSDRGNCWSAPIVLSRGVAIQDEPHPSIAVSPNGWSFLTWIAKASTTTGDQLLATRRQPVAPTCSP